MEVDFTPEQLENLSQIAANHGKNAEQFVKETALRAADEERVYLEAIDRAIEEADRGEFIDHEEVVARFERKFRCG